MRAKMVQPDPRPRLYDNVLSDHFARHRQMAFVSGPRQVGKTTTCRVVGSAYLNWDNVDDRRILLRGPKAVAEHFGLVELQERPPLEAPRTGCFGRGTRFARALASLHRGRLGSAMARGREIALTDRRAGSFFTDPARRPP